jgi:hypothetical protein
MAGFGFGYGVAAGGAEGTRNNGPRNSGYVANGAAPSTPFLCKRDREEGRVIECQDVGPPSPSASLEIIATPLLLSHFAREDISRFSRSLLSLASLTRVRYFVGSAAMNYYSLSNGLYLHLRLITANRSNVFLPFSSYCHF